MGALTRTIENIINSYENPQLGTAVILSVLLMALVLCIYEFIVYRVVSHRAFYNKSFNICIAVLPLFIATIILCLQSNIVITLGTIGALAIIRFRTAIKDPVDMLYLLWSVHIGITCGCQLYEVSVLTSLLVTVVLLIMENWGIGKKPFILVFHCATEQENAVLETLKTVTKSYRVKSRNYTSKGMNCVVELSVKKTEELANKLTEIGVEKFSVIEYDSDDVL
ncbi:MAG: DUF4956 domain-containing protein [Roseburia sp.]|nr:DUF4956 domain-containing protein [Roseburia sp.]